MKQRVLVFAFDFPYPPNRGGRADIWRRLVGLDALGCEIMLVCWRPVHEGPVTPEHLAVVSRVVNQVIVLETRSGIVEFAKRFLLLFKYPSHVSSRLLSKDDKSRVETAMSHFAPSLIWCEGPYPGAAALWASQLTRLPMAYRSHNVEHLYMARQAKAAKQWKDRVAWRVACIGLLRWELRMIDSAACCFDVSIDDMQFWRDRFGKTEFSWLPPIPQLSMDQISLAGQTMAAKVPSCHGTGYDVVFLGNLTTPNNVRGVEWLVQEIVPLVVKERPGTSFLIAGSKPNAYVRSLCGRSAAVTLLADPEDALPVYKSAKVLVNPVRSGSGIHVKSIEMLMIDAPIVSCVQGTQGMPSQVKECFHVSESPLGFAQAILAALVAPQELIGDREAARRCFGLDSLRGALSKFAASGA